MNRVFIWGTGKISKLLVEKCDILLRYEVIAFIDNNQDVREFYGYQVISPELIINYDYDYILIANGYYKDIREQLKTIDEAAISKTLSPQDIYKKMIFNRYSASDNEEIKEILSYIKTNDLEMFPYDFTKKYKDYELEIHWDNDCDMYYVLYNSKKIYCAKYLDTKRKIEDYFKSILIEQDKESPHLYESGNISVSKGDIIVDAGVAEGFFTLQNIDIISKAYLLEADESWIDALRKTFQPYMDKVEIHNVFLSSISDGKMNTIDNIVKEKINFLKMDIEGAEWDALKGAEKTINISNNIKCSICTYHRVFDGDLLKSVLEKYGFQCSFSKGFAWFNPMEGDYKYTSPTYFSRCLVRGIKN